MMERRRAGFGGLFFVALPALLALLVSAQPAGAFIEKLTHLVDIIKDSDQIFVARVKAIDPDRPSMVLERELVLKGAQTLKRMPINLTGDKEKHTPELLKRLAADLPVIVFITELNQRQLVLAYTNGTWFQVIGQQDGNDIRWAFTHVEIYLRRTFKGTTREMEQAVADAVTGKKKPPPADPKEKPGFGPEVETKPAGSGSSPSPLRGERVGVRGDYGFASSTPSPPAPLPQGGRGEKELQAPDTLLAVIALPFLMPIAALLNLLFPGLLLDQWRQYKIAVGVLLTQSTLIFGQFALRQWIIAEPARHAWLSNAALWIALVAVSIIGLALSLVRRVRLEVPLLVRPPARVEYLALGTLLAAGLGWGIYQAASRDRPFRDEMAVVTAGAALAFLHLILRRLLANGPERRALVTTEVVFLVGLASVGTALGWYLHQPERPNLEAGTVTSNWPMSRGNVGRSGTVDPSDPGPQRPTILWTFDPAERKGRVSFHSTPTFVDGQLYIGAMHEIQAFTQGYVYCIQASDGGRLWRFSADGAMKAVYSTPIVHGGQVVIGEGYHQDQRCRLYCLDGQSGALQWQKQSTSHIESSPCVLGTRVVFGAGDDGLICVDTNTHETSVDGSLSPKTIWQVPGVHVDASPLVVDKRVFVGSIIGDVHQDLYALAVNAETGRILWQIPAPLPLTASPAYGGGRVYFGLGNGKVNKDADRPAGALWCLDATSGRRLWEFPCGNSVFATPALRGDNVYFGSVDSHFYCLSQSDGRPVWKVNLGSPLVACPVTAAGRVYVLTSKALLVCLDAATGREIWRLSDLADDGIEDAYSSPILAHGRLYFAAGGRVYCVGDP